MQPCPTHKHEPFRRSDNTRYPRATTKERGYGDSAWAKCRKTVLKRDRFLCQACGERATLVHHEPPITGPDDPERTNPDRCQSYCRPCHERRHGRAR